MRRTKEWWNRLTKIERSEFELSKTFLDSYKDVPPKWGYNGLVYLERADRYSGRSGYIPDDCSECGMCGTPHLGTGLCPLCGDRLEELLQKAGGI